MSGPEIELITPGNAEDWSLVRDMLLEYQASLSVQLCFQNFDRELLDLPGQYAPAQGGFLLAMLDGAPAACGGFRALPDVDYANACEVKRLFVRPAFRRFGLGRTPTQGLMDAARQSGYSVMLLDTLDDMEAARGLYESLGFVAIPPYYFNPIPGAHYLKAELS